MFTNSNLQDGYQQGAPTAVDSRSYLFSLAIYYLLFSLLYLSIIRFIYLGNKALFKSSIQIQPAVQATLKQ